MKNALTDDLKPAIGQTVRYASFSPSEVLIVFDDRYLSIRIGEEYGDPVLDWTDIGPLEEVMRDIEVRESLLKKRRRMEYEALKREFEP